MANTRIRTKDTGTERVPLSDQRKNLLTLPAKPGFVRRIVNDSEQGQRIEAFKRAGWKIVDDESQIGDKGIENQNQSVGSGIRKYVGNGTTAIAMEIEEEFYLEDQEAKQAKIDRIEQVLYNGEGVEGKYGRIDAEHRVTKRK